MDDLAGDGAYLSGREGRVVPMNSSWIASGFVLRYRSLQHSPGLRGSGIRYRPSLCPEVSSPATSRRPAGHGEGAKGRERGSIFPPTPISSCLVASRSPLGHLRRGSLRIPRGPNHCRWRIRIDSGGKAVHELRDEQDFRNSDPVAHGCDAGLRSVCRRPGG